MAGKHITIKKRHWSPFVIMLAVAAMVAAISGTMAWLIDSPAVITNTFEPANIYIEVAEKFTNNAVKENVYIMNGTSEKPSETDVYIRAAIVANWQDDNGNVLAEAAVEGTDYILSLNSTEWPKRGDYYYCTAVNTDEDKENCTSVLINKCEQKTTKTGYNLVVTILAQAIQAEPANAVNDAWGEDIPSNLAPIPAGN